MSFEASLLVLECLGLQGYAEVTKATSVCRVTRSDTKLWLFSKSLYKHRSPLMYAAYKGNIQRLKFLLNLDYAINQQCNRGYTALMWAVSAGQYTSARLLLEHGANMYFTSSNHCSALLLALNNNNLDIVDLLLDFGLTSFQGSLNACLRLGHFDTAVKLKLKGAVADCINVGTMIQHKRTNSTLMWALHNDKQKGLLFESYLIDINYARKDGTTALMLACHYGNLNAVEKLIALGAHDSRRVDGLSTLLWACQTKNNIEVIKLLLRSGFDIDIHNNGRNALYYAIGNEDLVLITLLCTKSIDLYNSMHYMLSFLSPTSLTIAHILTSHGAIVRQGDIEQFLLYDPHLIQLFLNLELINPAAILKESNKSILEVSIYRNHIELMDTLLRIFETWSIANRKQVYNGCLNALIHSSTNNESLYSYFCGLVSQEERTKAFHLALTKEKSNVVKILISFGVNIDSSIKDYSGFEGLNPLMLACELNNPELILQMIDLGLSDIYNFYDTRTNRTIQNVAMLCNPKHKRYEDCMIALKSRGFET